MRKILNYASGLPHVMVGDGEVWYTRGLEFSSYVPWEHLSESDYFACVAVVHTAPVAMRDESLTERVRPFSAALRWVSRGLLPSNDCVNHACGLLRRGGISIPRRVLTPDDLYEHLRANGYTIFTNLGRPHA